MNRENVQKVRDHIAGLPPEQFDMADPGHGDCGTPACIGGWSKRLFAPRTLETISTVGRRDLDLSEGQMFSLFFPDVRDDFNPYRATTAQAVRVLDHLLSKGRVDWSKAGEP